ncbi:MULTISPECIES: hypothetical protein [Helicobacter]|uniref:Uncharacterized protein n=3 Tax=Helicobacter TaxID=209 RepID=T1D059_9HELI|nr:MULTISPECIES: hypothetical protein [Helicobacter]QOQ91292.1 hypothetical protein HW260_02830 [Helicobacter cinaedi]BAM32798.1 hypothetical protein HCBAA847_1568 [Helicobacter cinaedi CCUG 18818 = ATCC BAA-847]GAD18581.1 hypothetical protein HFN_1993 [Helicobacter fennelliae MRY12-0050]STP14485.1 Uncharacterised protein [Helicobacter fennelliae]
MRYFLMIFCIFFTSQAFDFSQHRCFVNSCAPNDKACHQKRKQILQREDIRNFNEITYCFRLNLVVSGSISNLDIDTENTCSCKANNQVTYCLPYIESPQDSSYPCSPKMLEIYEQQRQEKEAMCEQFKKDWIAKKYPCAFDSDKEAVSNCQQELYKKYCQ